MNDDTTTDGIPEPPPPPPPPRAPGIPWEEPDAGIASLLPTIGGFISRPIESFSRMSLTVDLVRPLAYYVIVVLIGTAFNLVWSLLFFQSFLSVMRQVIPEEARAQLDQFLKMPTGLGMVLQLVVTPFLALIALFIWTAIVHLVLVLIGGARNGFAASLRALCYSRTSALAQAIPFVGGFVALFWELAMQIIGLSQAHRTDGWKAAVAVFVPILLCCTCIVLVFVLFGAALVRAMH